MAYTRTQLKQIVKLHTGKGVEKDTLIELMCDAALAEAVLRHSFNEVYLTADVAVVANAIDLTLPTNLLDIMWISCRDDVDDTARPIWVRTQHWYNENVGDPTSCVSGIPKNCVKLGTKLQFERPFDDSYSIRICYTPLKPVFTIDATENPIPVLDQFLVHYVTAQVFMSIEDKDNYTSWMQQAIGPQFDWQKGSFQAGVVADERITARKLEMAQHPQQQTPSGIKTDDGRSWLFPNY